MHRLLLLVTLLSLACVGCQSRPNYSARQVGERFAHALETAFDAPIETYLTPDAQVFLQGSNPIPAATFGAYLERMQKGHQFYVRTSRVYVTRTGAGWFADIKRQNDTTPSAQALWMEVTIQDGRMSRVWVHFTVETLGVLHQPQEAYQANMAARCLPLPAGWAAGTPAITAAAEAYDGAASDLPLPVEGSVPFAMAGVALLGAAGLGGVWLRLRAGARARPVLVGQRQGGELLRRLREDREPEYPRTSITV